MEDRGNVRFGNYDLVRRIDVGGMGEVYLAHQRSAFGRLVAIKIIRSDLVHDLTARARFLREAEVSAYLKHEHILPLFEFGEDQGRLFLVTPYIEGGTLARRLQNGPLSLVEVRQLFVPLVQAVAYIHRRGVIHRDLKPTNILLDEEDGQVYVRLIDFGIATVQGRSASPSLTSAGNEVGTIAYMAPERLNGVSAPSNDIFSLGVILYQMLTGELPLGDELVALPPPVDYVVRRCITPRPEDRFASAEEVLKHFDRAYQSLMTSSLVRPAQAPAPALPAVSSTGQVQVSRRLDSPLLSEEAPLQEFVSLQDSGVMPAMQPQSSFDRADYDAPTTSFDPAKHPVQPPPGVITASKAPSGPPGQRSRGRRRGKSLLPLVSALTILVLLAIISMAYYGYQAVTASAVTVSFGPKTQAISQVFTMTASPPVQAVDVNAKAIPLRGFSSNKSATQSGPTTGQVNCIIGSLGCEPGVSQDDVDRLVAQMKPDLEEQIKQDLLNRMAAAGGIQVSDIRFTIVSTTSSPAVNQAAKSVTVTLVEQGSVGYVVKADVESVGRQLLAQQVQALGPGYMLVSSTITLGRPVVTAIDTTAGVVTMKIAAGGVAEYQFPQAQLQAIHNALKGRTVRDARAFLQKQPGIDPQSITIRFTSGTSDTLPGDVQHIRIIPLNPGNLPPVQLQAIPTTTTSSTSSTDTTLPGTVSPTPADNG